MQIINYQLLLISCELGLNNRSHHTLSMITLTGIYSSMSSLQLYYSIFLSNFLQDHNASKTIIDILKIKKTGIP
ncbi:MAG: hypothetical protein K0R47_35 [Brevibacillus sp.]|nr:hypothetical protein [Brevibacillus sp.]